MKLVVIEGREASGVAAHNATTPHQRWRDWGGMGAEVPDGIEVRIQGVFFPREPREPWDPAAPLRMLSRALASQDLVNPIPPDWRYQGGQRLPVDVRRSA